MGLRVEKRETKKKPSVKIRRTMQTSPIDVVMIPNYGRAREDAEILIKAAEIKRDNVRYREAKKLIRGASNI